MLTCYVLIFGSRVWPNPDAIGTYLGHLDGDFDEMIVISGMARGADRMAWEWANTFGSDCREFAADWSTNPKTAGFIRNKAMADYLGAKRAEGNVIHAHGFLDERNGVSRGSRHMMRELTARDIHGSVTVLR